MVEPMELMDVMVQSILVVVVVELVVQVVVLAVQV